VGFEIVYSRLQLFAGIFGKTNSVPKSKHSRLPRQSGKEQSSAVAGACISEQGLSVHDR
jgi:hypothetical protein